MRLGTDDGFEDVAMADVPMFLNGSHDAFVCVVAALRFTSLLAVHVMKLDWGMIRYCSHKCSGLNRLIYSILIYFVLANWRTADVLGACTVPQVRHNGGHCTSASRFSNGLLIRLRVEQKPIS